MDMHAIPFETQMLRDAQRFVGRWAELQLLVTAVDQRRPAIVIAPPRSGSSSLLFHAIAAGAVLLDTDELPAFYLDMAEFPNLEAVQNAIAEAFAPAGTPWLQAVLRAKTAPFLAFDNIDAPQFATDCAAWLHLLAGEVQAGRLRVIAAAVDTAVVAPAWSIVTLAPVGQAFLTEYLEATLPDSPHPSRSDQQFIVSTSHGHVGTLIVMLTLWYRSRLHPDDDWRTVASRHAAGIVTLTSAPTLPTAVSADMERPPTGGELLRPSNDAVESARRALHRGSVGMHGWVVLVALGVVGILWYWGSR